MSLLNNNQQQQQNKCLQLLPLEKFGCTKNSLDPSCPMQKCMPKLKNVNTGIKKTKKNSRGGLTGTCLRTGVNTAVTLQSLLNSATTHTSKYGIFWIHNEPEAQDGVDLTNSRDWQLGDVLILSSGWVHLINTLFFFYYFPETFDQE